MALKQSLSVALSKPGLSSQCVAVFILTSEPGLWSWKVAFPFFLPLKILFMAPLWRIMKGRSLGRCGYFSIEVPLSRDTLGEERRGSAAPTRRLNRSARTVPGCSLLPPADYMCGCRQESLQRGLGIRTQTSGESHWSPETPAPASEVHKNSWFYF